MVRRAAHWLAARQSVPTSLRAVFGYYGDTGVFAYRSLALKRRVDARVDAMLDETFAAVEEALAEEFGYDYVAFEYDTKLLLPAKLTLGQLYRTQDKSEHAHAETVTKLAIEALLDGDMRDAINDEEFEDFEVDFAVDTAGRRRVAVVAQDVIQARVELALAEQPQSVRENYDWAVTRSERHQDEDEQFREWMASAREGDVSARDRIRSEYKQLEFETSPDIFTAEEISLPYFRTQYDRVGVIYDAMIRIYRNAGLPIDDAFHRSIVLAIIGAQIWLDDVDDYEADMREGQLTPVTAEYLLADSESEAYRQVVDLSMEYLQRAKREATAADSVLTGVATEYIIRDGHPELLPGSS